MHSHSTLGVSLCPWLHSSFASLDAQRSESRLAHAWLLTGPLGVGKVNLALVIADRLLTPAEDLPEELEAAPAGDAMLTRHEPVDHHPDFQYVFPDDGKRSISIDQIRQMTDNLNLTSLQGNAKVVVIEPADAMTPAAADALLKTLEEPSANTYLLLVSHRPGQLSATIRSRCQILNVPRPAPETTLRWLERLPGGPEPGTWRNLLALSDGSPFGALTLNSSDYHSKNMEFENKFKLISRNSLDPQVVADEWLKEGVELPLSWLATRLRLAIRKRMAREASNPVTDLEPDHLHNAWQDLTLTDLFRQLEAAQTLLDQLGRGVNVDLALRVLLLAFHPQRGRS